MISGNTRKLLALASCLLVAEMAYGHRHIFWNYSVEDGLPQSQVNVVFQDSTGYLWVGTESHGIARYDGLSFETFDENDGLPNNQVLTVLEIRDGSLWVGTAKGVARLDADRFLPVPSEGAEPGEVHVLIEDRDGVIWAGTSTGLFRYVNGMLRPSTLPVEGGIHALHRDRHDILWVGTVSRGLIKYDRREVTTYTRRDGLPNDEVHDIYQDGAGVLWIATAGGLARLDQGKIEVPELNQRIERPDIRALLGSRDGTLWMATNGSGLCSLRKNNLECLTEAQGLSSDFIWSLAEDREGYLWIGTYRGGLDQYGGDRFVLFDVPGGFGTDMVRYFLEDHDRNLWLATFRHGVTRFDGKRARRFTVEDGLASDFVLSMFQDRDSNLWFGTYDGVTKFDGHRMVNYRVSDGLSDRVIRAIRQGSDGEMWFLTDDGGITILDERGFRYVTTEHGLNDREVLTVAEGGEGVVWIGTARGVTAFQDGEFFDFSERNGLQAEEISTLLEDDRGYLWIAAKGEGVYRCPSSTSKAGSCMKLSTRDGLLSDAVVSLAFDNRGDLWVGTERGVSRLDMKRFESLDEVAFTNFGPDEGFIGIECIQNAAFKDGQGNLWFGTVAGAYRCRPDIDELEPVEPVVRITAIRPAFESTELVHPATHASSLFELAHDQNNLAFEFIAISLRFPQNVYYRYFLEGWDAGWSSPINERRVAYQRLAPGEYTFRVAARTGASDWGRTDASFSFQILPPIWRTWWFVSALVLGMGLMIVGMVRLRVHNLEEQGRKLQVQVDETTRALRTEKEKVERVNTELEKRVARRTVDLVETNEALRQEMEERQKLQDELLKIRKLESMGVLAGGIAHDFNNLLTAIMGNITLAKLWVPPEGKSWHVLNEAERASLRAADLTQQLLTFSKGGEPVKTEVDFSVVVSESISFALRGKNVKVDSVIPEGLWSVEADEGQIAQVIHNLTLNAVQAMPRGGFIHVRYENLVVDRQQIANLEHGPYVLLVFRDEGQGIPPEVLPRIFDPYFTTKGSGAGLGLATAYSIITKHGGHISVESDKDKGTVCRVYLPATGKICSRTDSQEALSSGLHSTSHGSRILVMDDEQAVRLLVVETLSRLGHRVGQASDGGVAIQMFQKAFEERDPFKLVIMDLTIPAGMGGTEALKELKKIDPQVKAVVSSGYSNDPVMAGHRTYGFSEVLPKPFGAEDLGELVTRVLGESA